MPRGQPIASAPYVRRVSGILLGLLIAVSLAPGTMCTYAQDRKFPFDGFSMNTLQSVMDLGSGPERSTDPVELFLTKGGRLRGASTLLVCINDGLPEAAVETLDKPAKDGMHHISLHYQPTPLAERFACVVKLPGNTETSDVELRTSVTVNGNVYTFTGYLRSINRSSGNLRTVSQKAVVEIRGASCVVRSYRYEEMSEYNKKKDRDTQIITSDANTTCKLWL